MVGDTEECTKGLCFSFGWTLFWELSFVNESKALERSCPKLFLVGVLDTVKSQIFVRYPFSYFWLESSLYKLIFVLSRASTQNDIEIQGLGAKRNVHTVLNFVLFSKVQNYEIKYRAKICDFTVAKQKDIKWPEKPPSTQVFEKKKKKEKKNHTARFERVTVALSQNKSDVETVTAQPEPPIFLCTSPRPPRIFSFKTNANLLRFQLLCLGLWVAFCQLRFEWLSITVKCSNLNMMISWYQSLLTTIFFTFFFQRVFRPISITSSYPQEIMWVSRRGSTAGVQADHIRAH